MDEKKDKQNLWACFIPLILAVVCCVMSNYMWKVGREECSRGVDFFGDLSCASDRTQFLYDCFVYSIFVFIGLSIMLPFILDLNSSSEKQAKIFD